MLNGLTIQLSQNAQIQIGNLSTQKASTPFYIYNFSHEHISKNSVKTQLLKRRFIFQGCLFEHIFAFENSCWNMKYIFAFSIWFLNLVFPIKLFIIIFQKNQTFLKSSGGERERLLSRLHTQHRARCRVRSHYLRIMTWAETRSWMLNQPSHPDTSQKNFWKLCYKWNIGIS